MSIKAIFAYNQHSEGGKELAKALGVPRIKHRGSAFVGSAAKTILNWGGTELPPEILKCRVINRPEKIAVAINKLDCFTNFRDNGVPSPEFTTDRNIATRWCEDGGMVFARTILRGHSGNGIVIMDPEHPDTWGVQAPLYVKYVKKLHEYRVHIVNGEVIDTQRKGLRDELRGREGVNRLVRNLANGFVFVRNDGHVVPECVFAAAKLAVAALDIDFGAADVVYNQRQNRAYVLEVNTAPGLVGSTIENYANAIRRNY